MRTLTDGDMEIERLLLEFIGACLSNVKGWRMRIAWRICTEVHLSGICGCARSACAYAGREDVLHGNQGVRQKTASFAGAVY